MAGRRTRLRWIPLDTPSSRRRDDNRVMGPPIVFRRVDDADDSDTWDDLDGAERHLYRAARRTSRGVSRGLARYDEARAESAAESDDGVVVDMLPNVARGMATTTREVALVPLDLVRAAYRAGGRRVVRRGARTGVRVIDRTRR